MITKDTIIGDVIKENEKFVHVEEPNPKGAHQGQPIIWATPSNRKNVRGRELFKFFSESEIHAGPGIEGDLCVKIWAAPDFFPLDTTN